MKKLTKQLFPAMNGVVAGLGLTLALLLANGCASAGYRKGDTAAASLHDASAHIQAEHSAIELTTGTLSDLVNAPAADLKPQFKRFSQSLNALIASARRADAAGKRMNDAHNAYFKAWDQQLALMEYDVVRTRSQARKEEVQAQFQSVSKRYQEAQAAMEPLINYLADVRMALRTDLTLGGLESVKPVVRNADTNAGKVRGALNRLSEELASCGGRLSSEMAEAAGDSARTNR